MSSELEQLKRLKKNMDATLAGIMDFAAKNNLKNVYEKMRELRFSLSQHLIEVEMNLLKAEKEVFSKQEKENK